MSRVIRNRQNIRKKLNLLYRDDEHMVISSLAPKVRKYSFLPGASVSTGLVLWKRDRRIDVYMTEKARDMAIRSGRKFLNEKFARNYFRLSKNHRQKYNRFIQKTRKLKIRNLGTQELVKILSKLWDFEIKGIAFFWGSQAEPLIYAEKILRKILFHSFPKEKIEGIIAILLTLKDFDRIQKQEIDWAKIVFSKKSFTEKDFLAHGLKYPFIFRNSRNFKESFNYLRQKFNEDKKRQKDLKKEIINLQERKHSTIKRQKELLKRIRDKRINCLLWLFHKHAIERMELKYTWAGVEEFTFYDLFAEAAKRINENYYKMLSYYRTEDIINSLKNKTKLSEKEIKDRKSATLFETRGSDEYFYVGEKAYERVRKYYPELLKKEQINEIAGVIASTGKARGRAMVVFTEDPGELSKLSREFKKGQVLVTGMTQPNMAPLIRKASAIVTDEGGLTSHAAIISREFGIPCIVGTHKATQVLKNGDFVEVDANKGVVKIIK